MPLKFTTIRQFLRPRMWTSLGAFTARLPTHQFLRSGSRGGGRACEPELARKASSPRRPAVRKVEQGLVVPRAGLAAAAEGRRHFRCGQLSPPAAAPSPHFPSPLPGSGSLNPAAPPNLRATGEWAHLSARPPVHRFRGSAFRPGAVVGSRPAYCSAWGSRAATAVAAAEDGGSNTGGSKNAHAHSLARAPPEKDVCSGRSELAAQAPRTQHWGPAHSRSQCGSAARKLRSSGRTRSPKGCAPVDDHREGLRWWAEPAATKPEATAREQRQGLGLRVRLWKAGKWHSASKTALLPVVCSVLHISLKKFITTYQKTREGDLHFRLKVLPWDWHFRSSLETTQKRLSCLSSQSLKNQPPLFSDPLGIVCNDMRGRLRTFLPTLSHTILVHSVHLLSNKPSDPCLLTL
jgi:hypothetical protein